MIFWIDKLVLSGIDWSESSLSLTTSMARWVGMQVNSDIRRQKILGSRRDPLTRCGSF